MDAGVYPVRSRALPLSPVGSLACLGGSVSSVGASLLLFDSGPFSHSLRPSASRSEGPSSPSVWPIPAACSALRSLVTYRCVALESLAARSFSLPAVCDSGAPAALPRTPFIGPTLMALAPYEKLRTTTNIRISFRHSNFIIQIASSPTAFPDLATSAPRARRYAAGY